MLCGAPACEHPGCPEPDCVSAGPTGAKPAAPVCGGPAESGGRGGRARASGGPEVAAGRARAVGRRGARGCGVRRTGGGSLGAVPAARPGLFPRSRRGPLCRNEMLRAPSSAGAASLTSTLPPHPEKLVFEDPIPGQ